MSVNASVPVDTRPPFVHIMYVCSVHTVLCWTTPAQFRAGQDNFILLNGLHYVLHRPRQVGVIAQLQGNPSCQLSGINLVQTHFLTQCARLFDISQALYVSNILPDLLNAMFQSTIESICGILLTAEIIATVTKVLSCPIVAIIGNKIGQNYCHRIAANYCEQIL